MRTDVLFQRLVNDRFSLADARDEQDRRDRRHWNAGSEHAESIVRQWLQEERIEVELAELQSADCLDLRLKATLTGLEEAQEGMV